MSVLKTNCAGMARRDFIQLGLGGMAALTTFLIGQAIGSAI